MAYHKRSRAAFEADLTAQQSPYALYGTPLPPLDPDVRDDGSYVPIWKQEVRDERGRKRLHGAFTGGFSAGYFNTVGSKEGWSPATFVSSRTHRAKDSKQNVQQRPEDFMDEEDLREAEEERVLHTNQMFSGLGATEGDQRYAIGLMDLFRVGGETIGSKLLKKMGWREGQGIGPKIQRKARLYDAKDDDESMHLFAPDNPPMISFTKKNDYKGLGHEGEVGLEASTVERKSTPTGSDADEDVFGIKSSVVKKKKTRKDVKRTGFGVGVLNDDGSDDEDPYSIGPAISYNRVIGGDRDKKNKKKKKAISNPMLRDRPIFISKKVHKAGFRKCHDGRLPLEGFVLAQAVEAISSIVNSVVKYPPPEIPKDWKSSKKPCKPEDNVNYVSMIDAARMSKMDPKSRAAILGEAQLPSKSVFDFLSPAARNQLAHASGKDNLPPGLGEAAPKGYELTDKEKQEELRGLVPTLDKDLALQALARGIGGWMPYAEDVSKRARYKSYLEGQAGLKDTLPEQAAEMSKTDWVKELEEFAHAAKLFKPMTGLMATRFTTSSNTPKPTSVAADDSAESGSLLTRPTEKPDDPAEAAAKLGMFGPMTRTMEEFFPTRLLCKRFNVKPPTHLQPDDVHASEGSKDSSSRFQSGGFQTASRSSTTSELVPKDAIQEMLRDVDNRVNPPVKGEVVIDPERNEALEAEKPEMAAFRAIFGSDEE